MLEAAAGREQNRSIVYSSIVQTVEEKWIFAFIIDYENEQAPFTRSLHIAEQKKKSNINKHTLISVDHSQQPAS